MANVVQITVEAAEGLPETFCCRVELGACTGMLTEEIRSVVILQEGPEGCLGVVLDASGERFEGNSSVFSMSSSGVLETVQFSPDLMLSFRMQCIAHTAPELNSQEKLGKMNEKNREQREELIEHREQQSLSFECEQLSRKLSEKDQKILALSDKLKRAVENEMNVRKGLVPRPSQNSMSHDSIVSDFETQVQSQQSTTLSLQSDKDSFLCELVTLKNKLELKTSELETAENECSRLTLDSSKLRTELNTLALKRENEAQKTQSDLEYAKTEKEELQQQLSKAEGKTTAVKAELAAEIKTLTQDLYVATGKLGKLLRENEALKGDTTQFKADSLVKDSRNAEVHGQLKEHYENYVASLNEELSKHHAESDRKLNELRGHFERLGTQNKELQLLVSKGKTALGLKQKNLEDLTTDNEALSQRLSLSEYQDGITDDLRLTIKDLKQQNGNLNNVTSALREQLNSAKEHLLSQMQLTKEAKENQEQLNKDLFKTEAEKEKLQAEVTEMSCRKIYIPVRVDSVDMALAEYVNNRRLPSRIPFIRDDPGIYRFGFRKVYVKIENGQIVIRVGGGYMLIEEFLELYTPVELEKLARYSTKVSKSITNLANATYSSLSGPLEDYRQAQVKEDLLGGKFTTMYTPKKQRLPRNSR